MPTLVNGVNVLFKVYDGAAYVPVVCLKNNNLTETKNIIESQTKCNPGQIKKTPGSYTYEISIDGEYGYDAGSVEQYDDLRLKLFNGDLVQWEIEGYFADGTNANSYYGSGYLSEVSTEASSEDAIVTFSATLMGDGETDITQVNPNP